MTRFTDGKEYCDVYMGMWENNQYTPDASADLLCVGMLVYDEEVEAFVVSDFDGLDIAITDWVNYMFDLNDDECKEYDEQIGRERAAWIDRR